MEKEVDELKREEGGEETKIEQIEAVELGDFGKRKETGRRYLMGRMRLSLFTLPAYILETIGLGTSLIYVINNKEWSIIMMILGWLMTVLWIWMYSISYTYRRKVNNIYTLCMFTLYSAIFAYVHFERSLPQEVYDGQELIKRGFSFPLAVSGVAASTACLVIFVHAIYFGRGYRERREY